MESRLKESILKHLEYYKRNEEDPEEPFMYSPRVGKCSWTPSEIIEEVKSETEFGEEFADIIIGAAMYRLKKQWEKKNDSNLGNT